MTKFLDFILALGVVSLTVTGCATRGDFTAITSKNVNLASIKVERKMMKGRARGQDCAHIFVIIPDKQVASLEEAIDRALEPKQANLLMDAVLKHHWFYIPLVYGEECWTAEGDAYDTY